MHYKNGRPAKNGDRIVRVSSYGPPVAGILYDAKADGGSDCNGRIAIPTPSDPVADLKECLHADDVLAATIPDTTASQPAS